MTRIFVALCIALLANGYAEAKPMSRAKPTTVSGCTTVGLEGCYYLRIGTQRVTLNAEPGVAIPPGNTYIIATGTLQKVEIGFCGVTHNFHATSIVATKRLCLPERK